MNIKRIVVGDLQANCYIVENNNSCLIIDPGDEPSKIKESISKEVKGILITHNHFDHIGALDILVKDYNVKINEPVKGFEYEIIDTKGHTNDSKTFYFPKDKIMFTGDFLFKDSIGRLDLGGNKKDVIDSLNKIKNYPKDTTIYPGHGEETTMSKEIDNINYFINILQ